MLVARARDVVSRLIHSAGLRVAASVIAAACHGWGVAVEGKVGILGRWGSLGSGTRRRVGGGRRSTCLAVSRARAEAGILTANERTVGTRPPASISLAYRLPPEGPGIVQPTKSGELTTEQLLFEARKSGKTAAEFRGPDFSS